MTDKLQKINDLMINEVSLDYLFVVKAILNGEENLGEYKDFKRKVNVSTYWYHSKKIYDAIEDYMSSIVLMSAKDRKKVHVDLVKGILKYDK